MMYLLLWLASFAQLALIIFFYFEVKSLHKQLTKFQFAQHETQAIQNTNEALQHNVEKLQNALEDAIQDPVTRLPAWPVFEDRMRHEIESSQRYQFIAALMLVDIDEYNVITAALDREQTAALLLEFANRVKNCIRGVDSVSRYAKDRFGVLLTQLAKPESAAIVAQRILKSLSEPFTLGEQTIYLTAGIGISIYPEDSQDEAALIRHAEKALVIAKQNEKHTYQFHQEKVNLDSKRELAIHNAFQQAIPTEEFVIRYFPVFNVQTNQVVIADATVDWVHTTLGVIPAQTLFNYTTKYRKLNFIFEWLIKTSAQHYNEWAKFNFKPPYLALPFSIKQLENSQIIYRLSQTLQSADFDAKQLLLVMKDSPGETSYDIVEKAVNMLKYLGVQFLVDSFGSGAFPITQLKSYPVAFLRLHPSITSELDQTAFGILKSLLVLAKNLSIEIIAQDITSQSQFEKLKALGVTLMQGNYLSPPVPADEIKTKFMMPVTE